MGAVQVFDALHDAGLSVSLAPGGGLVVAPGSRLTPDLRELVKANKSALVDWLEAANDPATSVSPGLESAAPELPTDPDAWRELARAYYRHHFACHVCIAAGRGSRYGLRCGVGAALYRAYSDAAEDRSALDW